MTEASSNPMLENIRRALGRQAGEPISPRPPVLPARVPANPQAEMERLLAEINALSGEASRMAPAQVDAALAALVQMRQVRKASLWQTPFLQELDIAGRLQRLGVTIVPPEAGKHALADCDLGVTEADFALPETGTLGLLSAPDKPRTISLVPRLHLVLLRPQALRADLHQVFAEASGQPYLVFVTGPSRTSDIELTLTLGVHGPQGLLVWAFD